MDTRSMLISLYDLVVAEGGWDFYFVCFVPFGDRGNLSMFKVNRKDLIESE